MLKRPVKQPGTLVVLEHHSQILKGNPLGDPSVRKLGVWLPPQYDNERARLRRFPVLFDLVGFTGSGLGHVAWKNFGYNVPERAARLMADGRMGPVIIVFPDCFSALGGNQYVNSSALGNYADYDLSVSETTLSDRNTIMGLGDGGAHVAFILDAGYQTWLLTHWGKSKGRWDVPELIRRLTSDHLSGAADHRDRLWLLLVLELWQRRFMKA